MLNYGKGVESLLGSNCEKPMFMTNPLFLHFCLWFLYSDQKYFAFGNVCQGLVKYCVERIASPKLDLPIILKSYPSFDIEAAFKKEEELSLRFFKEVLDRCKNTTKALVVESPEHLEWILSIMKFQMIFVSGPDFDLGVIRDRDIIISMDGKHENSCCLLHLYKYFAASPDKIHLRANVQKMTDISHSLSKDISTLRLISFDPTHAHVFKQTFPTLSKLTSLSFTHVTLEEAFIDDLCTAVSDGHIPHITHLSLNNCNGLMGNLSKLFKCKWPKLYHLNLRRTWLHYTDLEIVFETGLLPNIQSLVLSTDQLTVKTWLLRHPWLTLTRLFLYNDGPSDNSAHYKVIKIPHLTSLGLSLEKDAAFKIDFYNLKSLQSLILLECVTQSDYLEVIRKTGLHELHISHSGNISGKLSELLKDKFPSLNSLILSNCGLNTGDLCSLVLASVEGRLPELSHLDISDNREIDFHDLFQASCYWKGLERLNIIETEDFSKTVTEQKKTISSKCLKSLQQLSVSDSKISSFTRCWTNFRKLNITHCTVSHLKEVSDAVEQGVLPGLHSVCVRGCYKLSEMPPVPRLLKANISLHEFSSPQDPFMFASCLCQLNTI